MSVARNLTAQPHAFDFIQVIRLLRAMGVSRERTVQLEPDVMPHGAPGEVTSVSMDNQEIRLRIGLEALSGCKGVIPDYLYAELLHSLHQDDHALQRFLDVFNQRYYELHAHVEGTASLLLKQEREAAVSSALSRLSQKAAIAAMFSLPQGEDEQSNSSMLRYGLALGNKSRSLSGLKQLLCDYFSLPIRPRVVSSSLYRISSRYQTRLGAKRGQNQKLGRGGWLGTSGTQAYKALEICITPRTRSEYLGLVSNAHFAHSMKALVQAYLRESLDIRLYMYVKREYIDVPKLSCNQTGLRLGEANCLAPHRRSDEFRKILIQPERV